MISLDTLADHYTVVSWARTAELKIASVPPPRRPYAGFARRSHAVAVSALVLGGNAIIRDEFAVHGPHLRLQRMIINKEIDET
jgi:hypothetical protein